MFEDITKRPIKKDSDDDFDLNSEESLAKFLGDKLGGHVSIVKGSGLSDEIHKPIFDKINALLDSLVYIAKELKIKPTCNDANGDELAKNDVLKCPSNKTKTVLEVGWKYVVLSHTDDETESDGPWFESEMSKMNFIKKK